jgi:DNA-binding PucR family transcriptional regulator
VVFSDPVRTFGEVPEAARAALSGLRAAPGWADAPRPIATMELLPERALAGDLAAAAELIRAIYTPLAADPALLATASSYLEQTTSLEATARALFIHPNTVRYRLRRIADLTGFSPTDNRGSYTIRLGLTLGRLL